ncbi:hypothetical protein N657DRAFT_631265 [Parathielavia appendiculata]|uniref:DUF6590 domain-containing protein n=1 Tax=Parathielavia appendiculata TaxID=2587402 RepID=A0AAN6U7T7_9PEZI|nr:hypothetical protein N657DRAFT_631265 [Parathielavia appendiculata]
MSSRWGEWTQWAWDAEQARWWRARQDIHGNVEYDFGAPRGNVDDLADSLNNVNLEDDQGGSYPHDGAYIYDSAGIHAGGSAVAGVYATSSASYAQAQGAFGGKGKSKAKSKSQKDAPKDNLNKHPSKKRSKPAAKNELERSAGQHDGPDPFYRRTGAASGSDYLSAASTTTFTDQQPYSDSAYGSSPHDPSFTSGLSQSPGLDQYHDQAPTVGSSAEVDTANPERRTRRGRLSDHGTAYPTSSVAEDSPTENQGSDYYSTASHDPRPHDIFSEQLRGAASHADPYMTGFLDASYSRGESSAMATAAHSYPYATQEDDTHEADGGRETPRALHAQAAAPAVDDGYSYPASMSGTQDLQQQIGAPDGALYVVEHSSKFRPGTVFKILWCEPLGAGAPRSEAPTNHVRYQQDGRTFYQGFRRFIVVANDEGHCTCVPILTYERQGCNKKGVKPAKHGIIYQAGKNPRMLPGEPQLGFDPVRVVLTERTETLSRESRVNYAKLTTVEHNFPVYIIGSVDPADFEHIVIRAVDHCWNRKKRHN